MTTSSMTQHGGDKGDITGRPEIEVGAEWGGDMTPPHVPEVYRVREDTNTHSLAKWLNEQAVNGYELHTMTGATGSEGTYLWAVVRQPVLS